MNQDGVAAAFELIIEGIETIAEEIASEGAKAFRDKAYDAAQKLSDDGKLLQEFRSKIDAMLKDWQRAVEVPIRQRFDGSRFQSLLLESERTAVGTRAGLKPTRAHTKAPKSRIRVTFSDGTTIEEYYAADTFALAIRHLGLGRVENLRMTQRNLSLVGDIRSDQYDQRRVDGKYIVTHSSSSEKKDILDTIARRLGVHLDVVIVEARR